MNLRHYITTPIYYVNAKPHVGHAYTTLVADVLARYYRLFGDDVLLHTGTDEHGAKIQKAAHEKGVLPQEFVDQLATEFQTAWRALNISEDLFWRTTSSEHQASATLFFERLYEAGDLYEAEYSGLYCVGCESFKTEKELTTDGFCPDHLVAPKKVTEKNWFFRLSAYLDQVRSLIEDNTICIELESIRHEVLGLFSQGGLTDFSVSRQQVEWGIPMPSFAPEQTMYVWIEALHNYLAAIGHGRSTQEFQDWWPHTLHVVGKDIIKFHCVWLPAMLLALQKAFPREGYEVVHNILVNGHFTVDGQKMSKSLGNVIDPCELVNSFGVDAARWLILSQFPFGSDGDIKAEKFEEQYTADLVNGVGNVASRILGMLEKYSNGVIPDGVLPSDYPQTYQRFLDLYSMEYRPLDVFQIVGAIRECVQFLDQDITRHEPWTLIKEGVSKELDDHFVAWLEGLRVLSLLLAPVLPGAANSLRTMLALPRFDDPVFDLAEERAIPVIVPGASLGERTILFPRHD